MLVLIFTMIGATLAAAQGSSRSSLAGVVVDADGGVLPGATCRDHARRDWRHRPTDDQRLGCILGARPRCRPLHGDGDALRVQDRCPQRRQAHRRHAGKPAECAARTRGIGGNRGSARRYRSGPDANRIGVIHHRRRADQPAPGGHAERIRVHRDARRRRHGLRATTASAVRASTGCRRAPSTSPSTASTIRTTRTSRPTASGRWCIPSSIKWKK